MSMPAANPLGLPITPLVLLGFLGLLWLRVRAGSEEEEGAASGLLRSAT